ncbi:hypothetical protein Tco_0958609 [Tanacetum coccineum]
MADRENTTIGNNWRRRALRFSLDEFYGRKVTIPVQWNYWKTQSQEVVCSPVNSSRNAKDPGGRESNHFKSSRLVPLECAMVSRPEGTPSATKPITKERVKVAINPDVPRYIAEHRLNVWEGCSPVRQKKRGQAADRNQAIQEEVGKLVEAGIMKEVHYHDWLSNPVMVKKHDDS